MGGTIGRVFKGRRIATKHFMGGDEVHFRILSTHPKNLTTIPPPHPPHTPPR